jgi:hypothetical protein
MTAFGIPSYRDAITNASAVARSEDTSPRYPSRETLLCRSNARTRFSNSSRMGPRPARAASTEEGS